MKTITGEQKALLKELARERKQQLEVIMSQPYARKDPATMTDKEKWFYLMGILAEEMEADDTGPKFDKDGRDLPTSKPVEHFF